MEEKPNYYAILPASVRYDKNLCANSKLLYAEITALSNKEGYCWATNKYFSELFGLSSDRISKLISNLVDSGYIARTMITDERTQEIKERRLYIQNSELCPVLTIPPVKNNYTPIVKNNYYNNINMNNKNNSDSGNNKKSKDSATIKTKEELQAWDFKNDETFWNWWLSFPDETWEALQKKYSRRGKCESGSDYINMKIQEICNYNGKKYKDYKRVLQNWINMDIDRL